ncbi:MAG: hypothetical protein WBO55_11380 [Rhizobiaceae bacterium]
MRISKPVVIGLLACTALVSTASAFAGDWPEYDQSIERAAARKAAEKLGDLRGGFEHDQAIASVKVRIEPPATRIPARRNVNHQVEAERLPPIVLNDKEVPAGVDPIMTGSTVRRPRMSFLLLPGLRDEFAKGLRYTR